jgi:hypothetical protein
MRSCRALFRAACISALLLGALIQSGPAAPQAPARAQQCEPDLECIALKANMRNVFVPGPLTTYGAGNSTCGAYLKSRRAVDEQADTQYVQWAWGFVTGFNATSMDKSFKERLDAETVLAYLDKYCRDNPVSSARLGISQLIKDHVRARESPTR